MRMWNRLLLKQKITWMVAVVCSLVLAIFEIVFLYTQHKTLISQTQQALTILAQTVAFNSASALTFNDQKSAIQTLSSLATDTEVISAKIIVGQSTVFAEYVSQKPLIQTSNHIIEVSAPIQVQGEVLGKLDVVASLDGAYKVLYHTMALSGLLGFAGLFVVVLLAWFSARHLTKPILHLAEVANAIEREGNYELRAPEVMGNDEAAQLARRFNEMLAQIEAREDELESHRGNLEREVVARTRDLIKARDIAESASRAKSDFLAMMSHEVRTPLNGIIGMTDLISNTLLTDLQQRYVRITRRSSEDLLDIINDILDFSKIEAGKLLLDLAPVDLNFLLEDVVEKLAPSAQSKNIAILCSPLKKDAVVIADAKRLAQVLKNLVGNAIKFTEHGEVVLRAELQIGDEDILSCRISVKDTGIGISEEQQQNLFNAFMQADSSTTRRFGGTGLGLVISQRLVQQMGGQIIVFSKLNQGSEFSFTLSFKYANKSINTLVPMLLPELQGLRALILDDNLTNLEILSEQLSVWGIQVSYATNVSQAIERVTQDLIVYDLIIADIILPYESGIIFIEKLRTIHTYKNTPVIVLSSAEVAYPSDEMLQQSVSAILTKPVKQSELFNSICKTVNLNHSVDRKLSNAVDSQPMSPIALKSNVQVNGNILLVEDNLVNQEVAIAMLHNLGLHVEVANNGADAIYMLNRFNFDVILMDCQMPIMDGFQAAVSIRERERIDGGHTPIIALTANAVVGDREKCISAGMDDYLAKPFTQVQLSEMLNAFISVAPIKQINSQNYYTVTELVDMKAIESIRNLRANLLPKVLDAWFKETPQLLANMKQALAEENSEIVFRTAHSLKNSCSNIGARPLARLCIEIEQLARKNELTNVSPLVCEAHQIYSDTEKLLAQLRDGSNL